MEVNTTMVGVLLRDSLTLGCKSLTAGNTKIFSGFAFPCGT